MTAAVPSATTCTVAIVGAGPRGTSVLERLVARLRAADAGPRAPLELRVFDPAPHGPGAIWNPAQPAELLMNSTADEVTLFPDAGPGSEGPTLYEWVRLLSRAPGDAGVPADVRPEAARAFAAWPPPEPLPPRIAELCRAADHLSYLPRAVYGAYLAWLYAGVVDAAPEGVAVRAESGRVVGLRRDRDGDAWAITTDARTTVRADAVVLALGWLEAASVSPLPADAANAWLPPGSVLRHDLDAIPADARVLVRGLGLTAFDVIARLSEGRGGRFAESDGGGNDPSGVLRYLPSGREPVLLLGSGSGVPFRAKPARPLRAGAATHPVLEVALAATAERPVDFARRLWPAVHADAAIAYQRARVAQGVTDAAAVDAFAEALLDAARRGTLSEARVAELDRAFDERFTPDALVDAPPHGGDVDSTGAGAYSRWLRSWLLRDAARAERGTADPLTAAMLSIAGARRPLARFTRGRVLDAESFRAAYRPFTALGARLGGGTPPIRLRQLAALIDAGVATGLGSHPRVERDPDSGALLARSDQERNGVPVDRVVDAWVPAATVARTADPLLLELLAAGVVRRSCLPGADGGEHETDGIDITEDCVVVDAEGRPQPGLYSIGIPSDDVSGHSFISPAPGAGDIFLRETDRVAELIVRALARQAPADQDRPAHDDAERPRAQQSHAAPSPEEESA